MEKLKTIFKRVKDFIKWRKEVFGIIASVFAFHVFTWLIYWYDKSSTVIDAGYLNQIWLAAIYTLFADFFAIHGVKYRHKPIYDYYREVKIQGEKKHTQYDYDFIDSFHNNNQHRIKRIWYFYSVYFAYFFAFLLALALIT